MAPRHWKTGDISDVMECDQETYKNKLVGELTLEKQEGSVTVKRGVDCEYVVRREGEGGA